MITYDEICYGIKNEKTFDMDQFMTYLSTLNQNYNEYDENGEYQYNNTSRSRINKIVKMISDENIRIYGTEKAYHNCAVTVAKLGLLDMACSILRIGLKNCGEYTVVLLSDFIQYGSKGNELEECQGCYERLKMINKREWDWRSFSFSIDYLGIIYNSEYDSTRRNELKREMLHLAKEFIKYKGDDIAYFDYSVLLEKFGRKDEEKKVLMEGIEKNIKSPRCSLKMADIDYSEGNYSSSLINLEKCCLDVFNVHQDINYGYSYLLKGICQSILLMQKGLSDENKEKIESITKDIYKAFHIVRKEEKVDEDYSTSIRQMINVLETQTQVYYTYSSEEQSYAY